MHHARIYGEIIGSDLVGVVDINEDRARQIGGDLGVPSFTDLDAFLDTVRPDALSIAVPTSLHHEVAVKAMQRGVHVLIEKPVTTRVEQAEELLALASAKNLVLQVGHIERFNSAVQYVQKMVREPLFIRTTRLGLFSPRISDVGVVLDLMIHDIDVILALVNSEIVEISAMGRKVKTDHEDIASAQISFANGAFAEILVSRVTQKRVRLMEILEQERFISVNFETQDVSVNRCLQQSSGEMMDVIEYPVFPKREPLRLELQHFISCVRDGKQPLVGIRDGKRALEVCISVLKQIHMSDRRGGLVEAV